MPWADVPAFEMSPCVARAAAPASVERMGEHPSTLGSLAGLEAVATGSCRSACGEMDVFDASGTMTLNRPKSPDPRSQCGRGYGLVWTSISMNMFDSDPRLAPSPSSPRSRPRQAAGDASHDAPRSCRGFSSAYRANSPSAPSRVFGRRLCVRSRTRRRWPSIAAAAIVSDCRVGQLPSPPITAYVTSVPQRSAQRLCVGSK